MLVDAPARSLPTCRTSAPLNRGPLESARLRGGKALRKLGIFGLVALIAGLGACSAGGDDGTETSTTPSSTTSTRPVATTAPTTTTSVPSTSTALRITSPNGWVYRVELDLPMQWRLGKDVASSPPGEARLAVAQPPEPPSGGIRNDTPGRSAPDVFMGTYIEFDLTGLIDTAPLDCCELAIYLDDDQPVCRWADPHLWCDLQVFDTTGPPSRPARSEPAPVTSPDVAESQVDRILTEMTPERQRWRLEFTGELAACRVLHVGFDGVPNTDLFADACQVELVS